MGIDSATPPHGNNELIATPPSGVPHAAPPPPSHPTGEPGAECVATEDNIEGPFFKPNAPSRVKLVRPDAGGTRLALSGRVLTVGCAPIVGAKLEVWHADHEGGYDPDGFLYRTVLTTDAEGRFHLDTIIPGRYLNGARYRPAHVHVKAHAPSHKSLTTQLYFEGDPYNVGDPFIRQSLVMGVRDGADGKVASHDIVLV